MNTTIKKAERPELFKAIREMDPFDQEKEYRGRGSTFYTVNIYFIDEDWIEYWPSLEDLKGTYWMTETFITSEEDSELCYIDEVYRAVKEEKVVTTYEWNRV